MAITFETVTVTQEMALELLANGVRNRQIDDFHVLTLKRLMEDPKLWRMNGDTIKLDIAGQLVDGQHRLTAFLGTNYPEMAFHFVRGIESDTIFSMDIGRPRALTDVFHIKHPGYTRNKASVAVNLMKFYIEITHLDTGFPKHGIPKPTIDQHYNLYMRHHKKLDWWIKYVMGTKHLKDFNKSNLVPAFFLLERKWKKALVWEFLEKMMHGGDYAYSPSFQHPKFTRHRRSLEIQRHRHEDFTMTIKAFEDWVLKKEMHQLEVKIYKKLTQEYYKKYKLAPMIPGKNYG